MLRDTSGCDECFPRACHAVTCSVDIASDGVMVLHTNERILAICPRELVWGSERNPALFSTK